MTTTATETTAMPVQNTQDRGLDIITAGSAQEMAARLTEMKQRLQLVQAFFKEVMVEGQDYGVIPGTDKPTLLKSGGEKLCEFYGFAIRVVVEREDKDRVTGFYDCAAKVQLLSRRTGELIAEGVGEANTYEARYRYRWLWPNQVPASMDKSVLVTRQTKSGDVQYRMENDDLFSLWNTVRKMAKKRAFVDAVMSATRSSGLFTQDLEDLKDWIDVDFEEIGETNSGGNGAAKNGNGQAKSTNSSPAMTLDEALDTKVTFGKYEGTRLGDMLKDQGYLKWLAANAKDPRLRKAAEMVLANPQKSDFQEVTPGEILQFETAVNNSGASHEIASLVIRHLKPGLVADNGHILWHKIRTGSRLYQQLVEVFNSGKWQKIWEQIEAAEAERSSKQSENPMEHDDIDLDNLPF